MPKIAAISIYVHDINQAEDFYSNLLCFKVTDRPAPFLVELEHDGLPLMLCAAERASSTHYSKDSGTVLGLATRDVVRQAADLRAKGATVLFDEPQEFPVGVFNVVRDPSGNAIELLEFRQ
ncbi:MAG: glyoxalase [Geminicoccaceae bacterium]|nr:glyoxalase [Geminicoccaceae bacterium]